MPAQVQMSAAMAAAVQQLKMAEDSLSQIVYDELAATARRLGLSRMEFLLVTICYKRGKEIEVPPEIEALENVFLENIHPNGFQDIWTRKDGWITQKDKKPNLSDLRKRKGVPA